jgi:hypothetical protein
MRYLLLAAILLSGCGSNGSSGPAAPVQQIRGYTGPVSSPHSGTATVQTDNQGPTDGSWDLTNIVIAGAPPFTSADSFTSSSPSFSGSRSFNNAVNGLPESDTWSGSYTTGSGSLTLVVALTLVREVNNGAGGFVANTYNVTVTFVCPQVSGPG